MTLDRLSVMCDGFYLPGYARYDYQRIKLLEEMAGEIYKEWFVRLRFPGYENTRFFGEDGAEMRYPATEVIPEGWKESRLRDNCDFVMGQSPSSEFYNDVEKGLPFHQGVTNFNNRFPTHVIFCSDLKRIADEGDSPKCKGSCWKD